MAEAGQGEAAVSLARYPGLDARITILRAGDEVDAVFVRTARFGVLVDTLGTPALCREALRLLRADAAGRPLGIEAAGRPLVALNSHMDWDHFWGNAALGEAVPILAHAAALPRFHGPEAARLLGEKAAEAARFRGFRLVGPSLTFSGAMTLEGGDLALELLHTPGHTPDHVAVWIPALRTCLAVDAVEAPIPEVWRETAEDLHALRASLRRIAALEARFVVTAHGRSCDPALVLANLAYFEALERRVAALPGPPPGRAAALAGREGFRLWDLVPRPAGMPAETAAFYEGCHRTNLGATLRARFGGAAPG